MKRSPQRLVVVAASGMGLLLLVWSLTGRTERAGGAGMSEGEVAGAEESHPPAPPAAAPRPRIDSEPTPVASKEPQTPVGVREPATPNNPTPLNETEETELQSEQEARDLWPESWPSALQPGPFTRASDSAFSDCPPDDGYTYLGVECSEAPCVLMFYVARDENREPGDWDAVSAIVETCPPWNTEYPTAVERLTRCSLSKPCGATPGWFLMIAPSDALDFASETLGTADEDWKQALQARCASASRGHACPIER